MIKITITSDNKKELRMTTFLRTIENQLTGIHTEYDLVRTDYTEGSIFLVKTRKIAFPVFNRRKEDS